MKRLWPLGVGLVLGLGVGLFYAWRIDPVRYENVFPWQMQAKYRADWIQMAALAYGGGSSSERTELRLTSLAEAEIRAELDRTLNASAAQGSAVPVLRRVAELAQRYGVESPAVRVYTGLAGVVPPSATQLPSPTPTRRSEIVTPYPNSPTATPTPAPVFLPLTLPPPVASPYQVVQQERICNAVPFISLSVTEEITTRVRRRVVTETVGVPGLTAWVLWGEGADRAVTGMRPQEGAGYADFEGLSAAIYNLYLDSPTGAPVAVLSVEPCTGEGEQGTWSAWILEVNRDRVASLP